MIISADRAGACRLPDVWVNSAAAALVLLSGAATARAEQSVTQPPPAIVTTPAQQALTPEPAGSGAAPAQSAGARPAAPAGAARKFEIKDFEIEGNTVLEQRDIERAVMPFLGPDRTTSDIDGARAALEKAYATKGFQTVYVVIPPQTVRGGVVRLQVVETRVGQVSVKGQHYSTQHQIRAGVPSLAEGAVPDLHELNKELVQLNSQRSDLQVTPQMAPGAQPQTIDVNLDVADHVPMHGSLELNNRYSRDTHPLRLQGNLSYDDLWREGHSVALLYSVAPQNRADGEVYALTYTAPIPDSGVKLSLTGLKSNSNVTTLGSTDVLGKGQSATLAASVPLGTFGSYFNYLQVGWAYKHFTNTISTSGQTSSAPITYFPVSITYAGSYRGSADQISFNTGLVFAFRRLGSDHTTYDYTRYGADGDLAYLRSGITWLHNLPWGFDLFAEVDGELANGPLVSNEQFSIGGDGSVRGYLQSEGLGDNGVRGSLELRSPTLAPLLGKSCNDLRLVVFSDTAHARLLMPLPEQQASFSMTSVGFGVTAQAFHDFYATAFVGDPLKSTAGPGASGVTEKGHPRVQFRLYTQF